MSREYPLVKITRKNRENRRANIRPWLGFRRVAAHQRPARDFAEYFVRTAAAPVLPSAEPDHGSQTCQPSAAPFHESIRDRRRSATVSDRAGKSSDADTHRGKFHNVGDNALRKDANAGFCDIALRDATPHHSSAAISAFSHSAVKGVASKGRTSEMFATLFIVNPGQTMACCFCAAQA